jgi:hypothetical protein
MKRRQFDRGLLALVLAGLLLTGAAGAEEIETFPLLGPADWTKVDGQDHDLDEMLSLMRPPGAETLAIFAPLLSWKPFYDKIYGLTPVDLTLYAAVYRLPPGDSDPPSLDDWPSFYQESPTGAEATEPPSPAPPLGEPLLPPSPTAVTFKTTIASTGEDGRQKENTENKTTYMIITSIISTRRQIYFLNLLQTDPADSAELERLALTWRDEFLDIQTQAEESQNGNSLGGLGQD